MLIYSDWLARYEAHPGRVTERDHGHSAPMLVADIEGRPVLSFRVQADSRELARRYFEELAPKGERLRTDESPDSFPDHFCIGGVIHIPDGIMGRSDPS